MDISLTVFFYLQGGHGYDQTTVTPLNLLFHRGPHISFFSSPNTASLARLNSTKGWMDGRCKQCISLFFLSFNCFQNVKDDENVFKLNYLSNKLLNN